MGLTSEEHYKQALELLDTIEVLIQPQDIADIYKEAAAKMKAAGDYKDARERAKIFEQKAVQVVEEGKETLYRQACIKMEQATKVGQRKLVIDMFQRISGYKDADELAQKCIQEGDRKKHRKTVFGWAAVVLAVIGVALVLVVMNQPVWKYRDAEELFAEGKFSDAKAAYKQIIDYKDSAEKIELCDAGNREKKREQAIEIIRNIKFGKTVEYGKYSWVVLKRDEKSAMLLAIHSDKVEELSAVRYNETRADVTWEDSSLRKWLNGEFLENGFNEEERSKILLTDVVNEDNADYQTDGGNDTQDYVYMLSMSEAGKFSEIIEDFSLNWLLRTPGNAQDTVAYVTDEHGIMSYGCPVDWDTFFIRPVINVDLQ